MTGEGWEYAAVLAASALISLVLTPLFLRLALRRGLLDRPAKHKGQASPVPYLGGLAIVLALSTAIFIVALVRPPVSGLDKLGVVLLIAIGLSVIGLVDDLRDLGPGIRVVAEAGAGLAVWAVGAGAEFTGSGATDAIVTVLWVVGITNAFNLLDNADGLAAGVAAICAGSFFLIADSNGQFLVAALAIALAGGALGFLRHNVHPARIYMGDAGSLYLGFVLSYVALKLRFDTPRGVALLVPVVVLAVPILDTTLVVVTRIAHGRSPFQGGRDHLSHRLMRLGLSVPWAVGVLYLASASAGMVALVMSRVENTLAYLLAGLVGVVAVSAGVALGRVPVYEPEP